jgi:hypothetical protein
MPDPAQPATAWCVSGERPRVGVARPSRSSQGFPKTLDTLKTICKQLKQRCGVGGAVKGDTLEIQGDQRATCQEHLKKMGYEVKLSGG